jgi:hypothetical protein
MDPNLPGLLSSAAQSVAEVRQQLEVTLHTLRSLEVPPWKGRSRSEHVRDRQNVVSEFTGALAHAASLETALRTGVNLAVAQLEREAAERAAESR